MTLKVYTHNKFRGHWPVGSAAVVIAEDRIDATTYLEEALRSNNLEQNIDPDDFDEVPINDGSWSILCDGNY